MYRVEWMKKGERTVYWDGFANRDVAFRFMAEKREDEKITMLAIVSPFEPTLWF